MIRCGTSDDFDDVEKIAKQYSKELGWVRRNEIKTCRLIIVGDREGYCLYNLSKKGYITIYSIAVANKRKGLGKEMLTYILKKAPTQLKVPVDSEAVKFYDSFNRFSKKEIKGRKRNLYLYRFNKLK